MKNLAKLACILVIAISSGLNTSAQQITASIRGKVEDASGGVVGGASVTAMQVETGFARAVRTDSAGVRPVGRDERFTAVGQDQQERQSAVSMDGPKNGE